MCRIGTSGEGMRQRKPHDRNARGTTQLRAALWRGVLSAALIALLVGLGAPAAHSAPSAWNKFMQFLGMKPPAGADIDYTERSPLVVPSTRDLSPPTSQPPLVADWPNGPPPVHRARRKAEIIPPAVPINNPNPPVKKKAWYNPASWFSKEEYAKFTGEPARVRLTDPPAGYRTPSPDEPYGVGRDKKGKTQAKVTDFGYTPVGGTH